MVVVEVVFGISCGVASEACSTFVYIARYAIVVVVGFGIGVASGASYLGVVVGVGMTIHASIPFTLMCPAVNGEVLCIVIESSGYPFRFGVAVLAIGTELSGLVIGIGGAIIIVLVATHTSIGCIVVVAIVASGAFIGDGSVRPVEGVEVIVYIKCGRLPIRSSGMTRFAICGKT